MTDTSAKSDLRKTARRRRRDLADAVPDFALRLACHAEALAFAPGTLVGGYHALPGEADPALLLERLVAQGCHIAFPRVAAKDRPLQFHLVPDGEVLTPGAFGIHEPLAHWPVVSPQVLLVPLLAFDAAGHRLGTGGGFYDRTLAALSVRAIGIAFAGQEVAALPREPHDRPLDAVLTENGLRHFTRPPSRTAARP
jgi:5-formyltetrahydrofolate cyclo-ligase